MSLGVNIIKYPLPEPEATQSTAGLMSSTDKTKLDGIASGASATLTGLTDTSVSSPSNGQVLGYNGTSGKWENKAASGVFPEAVQWSQAKTSVKKNLLKVNSETQDYLGITVDPQADGSLKVYGTATATSIITIADIDKSLLSIGNQYILSGCPVNGAEETYRVDIRATGETTIYDTGSGVTFTYSQGYSQASSFYVAIRVASGINMGTSSEPTIFYPMIRPASIADDTFAPYILDNVELADKIDNISVMSKTRYTISAANWSNSVDADGYYTYTITLSTLLSTSYAPNVYIAGANDSTFSTATEKEQFALLEECNLTASNTLVLYATTKPESTFYIFAEGQVA